MRELRISLRLLPAAGADSHPGTNFYPGSGQHRRPGLDAGARRHYQPANGHRHVAPDLNADTRPHRHQPADRYPATDAHGNATGGDRPCSHYQR